VRQFKIILTIVILAAALLAVGITLFWERLLTAEQKLSYGLVFSSARDFAARARARPTNERVLADYVDVLVKEGNLGRAAYLSKLYNVPCEQLEELRHAVKLSMQNSPGPVYALSDDPKVQAVADLPAGQAFAYLEGYRHALTGDWASAKNFFSAINERQLAPALRPYRRYYLARAYRLAGEDSEQAQVADLLLSIIREEGDTALAAKARYNLIAWYLSGAYAGNDGLALAKDQELSLALAPGHWAMQKSYYEFAAYYWQQDNLKEAWPMAVKALSTAPEERPGEAAGELVLEILEWIIAEHAGEDYGDERDWFVNLELPAGLFTDLARAGIKHSYAVRVAKALDTVKTHLLDAQRESWEEVRCALAYCYRAEHDEDSFYALMNEANLLGVSDECLAEIYYEYAQLLEGQERYNSALEYYRASFKLGGEHAGEALYQCYAILKQVQDPLNLDRAVEYLRQIVEDYPQSTAMPKAVEELLPLLIYRDSPDAAHNLINWVLKQRSPADTEPAKRAALEEMQEVARYFRAYLYDEAGQRERAAEERTQIPLKYFNYYELTANYPPAPVLAETAQLLNQEESAGEYFAGLGLTDAALEYYTDQGDAGNPMLVFAQVCNAALEKDLATRQYLATEVLENGQIQEQALLSYVLREAYPRPYEDEVRDAAAATAVEQNLIYAVMKKESNFNPEAVSWVGAEGLMQLMPGSVRWLISARGVPVTFEDRLKPAANIRLGASQLKYLQNALGANNTRAVIHAYNGGEGNYQRWRSQYPGADAVLFT